MRISHRYRFIFFANPKTGSSSVRRLLDPYTDCFPVRNYSLRTDTNQFYPHMTPAEAKVIFQLLGWNFHAYQRFTLIRNPWARLVSLYEHVRRSTGSIEAFADWLTSIEPDGLGGGGGNESRWRRYGAYSISNYISDAAGNGLVNRVIRLEDVEQELLPYLRSIGLPISGTIPRRNVFHSRRHYVHYYTSETADHVARLYDYDIRTFGYVFGE